MKKSSWAILPSSQEDEHLNDLHPFRARAERILARCRHQLESMPQTVFAAVSWSACSTSMTLLNKKAVMKTGAPLAVVALQMLATVCFAALTRNLKFGEGTLMWTLTVPPLYAAMMATSIMALSHVSVGTFVVVRNMGPIVTLGMEQLVHRPDNLSCNVMSVGSTASIAIGVALYEYSDVRFSPIGVIYLLLNLSFACAERMLQRHLLAVRDVQVSKPGLMLINNLVGACLTLLIMLLFGEARQFSLLSRKIWHLSAALPLFASCIAGALISYTGLWLQSLVTATSFMVLGCFNKILVIGWGMVMLRDSSSPLAVIGATISIAGCYLYSRIKE